MRKWSLFWMLAVASVVSALARADNQWFPVGQEANDAAQKENKLVLQVYKRSNVANEWADLIATDSFDKLDKEVFSTPGFQEFARKYLVLQLLDYSAGITRDDKTQQALHQSLQYWQPQLKVYPTLLLHDSHWVELGRREGYKTGQADEVMAWMREIVKRSAAHK